MSALRPRFELLDGMRGIAAILIVQRHASDLFGMAQFQSTYLAVDLFFVLSGFVIAHAYEKKLRSTLTVREFVEARALRLLPMYWVGLLATFLYVVLHKAELGQLAWGAAWGSLLLNAVFVPAPKILSIAGPFLVGPAWSLAAEAVANIAYAIVGRFKRKGIEIAVMMFGGLVMLLTAYRHGSLDFGYQYGNLYVGFGRVFYSFFAGVLVFRFRETFPKCGRAGAIATISAVIVALCLPVSGDLRPVYDLVVVWVAFPALVGFAWSASLTGRFQQVCVLSGAASYPIYVLHVPAMEWLKYLLPKVTRFEAVSLAPWSGIALLVGLFIVSILTDRHFDAPVRRAIKQQFFTKKQSAETEVAPL